MGGRETGDRGGKVIFFFFLESQNVESLCAFLGGRCSEAELPAAPTESLTPD